MTLKEIPEIAAKIVSLLARNNNYTFDKIVAILYANNYDVDSFRVAQALLYTLQYEKLMYSIEDEWGVLFGLA
jgi:hypothetical protein